MHDDTTFPATKRCSRCKEVKPVEAFGFYRTRNKYRPECNKCRQTPASKAKEVDMQGWPEGHRRCTRCFEIKPFDAFYKASKGLFGISPHCIVCDAHHCRLYYDPKRKPRPVYPEGYKFCKRCDQIKPLDEFYEKEGTKTGRTAHCKICNRERGAKYHAENRVSLLARQAMRRAENGPKKGQYSKNKERIKAYHQAHPEKVKANIKAWAKRNPDKVAANGHRYRTRRRGNGGNVTDKDIAIMRFIQQGHCAYCYRVGLPLHIEHIIPVLQGGPSDPWNLCLACQRCNNDKGGKTLDQWVKRWYLQDMI